MLDDPANIIEVSPATHWENTIKISLGKHALPEPFQVFIEREISDNNFRILPIEPRHTSALTTLPFHDRDPFGRLIIAPKPSSRTFRLSAATRYASRTE